MTTLAIFLFATTGLTMIVVRSAMFLPFRIGLSKWYLWSSDVHRNAFVKKVIKPVLNFFNKVLECELCFSFWAGMATHLVFSQDYSYKIVIFGFVSSGFVYIYTKFVNYLDGKSCKN